MAELRSALKKRTSGATDDTETDFDLSGKKIFVCGHKGMVGCALLRRFQQEDCEVLTADRNELDLRDDRTVGAWFEKTRPNTFILAAAKVEIIMADDTMPVPFLLDNLRIQNAVINAAFEQGVEKFLFLGLLHLPCAGRTTYVRG